MGEFFKGWRRKVGVVTLAMALVFMGGWVRSLVIDDFMEFPFADDSLSPTQETFSGLATRNQSLVLYWSSKFDVITTQELVTTPIQQASFTPSPSQSDSGEIENVDSVASQPLVETPASLYFEYPKGSRKFGDQDLYLLGSIKNLTRLLLDHTALTEDGLKELKGLKNLDSLYLGDIETTEVGMKAIAGLENLTSFGGTKITNAGLKEIKRFKKLTNLSLINTAITDDGLKEIRELKQLTALYLSKTMITDAGLKEIADLNQLIELFLTDTQVTDVGLQEISKLSRLRQLDLSGTRITDAGLKELARLKGLDWVSLERTKTTKAGSQGT